MAFEGIHIACGISASDRTDTLTRQPLFGGVVWSKNLLVAGKCPEAVRGDKPVVRLKASSETGDWWVAFGPGDPDPSQDPRVMIEAGQTEDYACKPGDNIAVLPA